jgi:hypothetical protein
MTDRQQIAFEFPCASGPESTHERFWSLTRIRGRVLSTILTLDTFDSDSPPVWHASVAVVPARKMSAATKRICIATAKLMLAGRGEDASSTVDQTDVAVHYQRGLSDRELEALKERK